MKRLPDMSGPPFLRATQKTRCSFFSEFLAAMHESRRCQAAREIRHFEHLLREAGVYEARARQAHIQPCVVLRANAVPARPPWPAMRANTLGQAWLVFARWIAKPSARRIGGGQSS